jgi:hypothetical protein
MKMKIFHKIRIAVIIGWVSFVCVCYSVYYVQYLQKAYPILGQIHELGILGLVKRYFTP